jgi:hypothetical protein
MFDFFCRFDPINIGVPSLLNPFQKVEAYNLLEYDTQEFQTNNCEIITLSRRKKNWQSTYSGSRFTILVNGYLFLLDDNKVTIARRFTANQIHDWLLDGKKIDVNNFKGAYSILVYDHEMNSLSIITDPLNVRYVLFKEYNGFWLISTSLDAIIAYMKEQGTEPELNWKSLIQHYLFDFILDDETFIEGVNIVPPATIITLDINGIKTEKYWDIFKEVIVEKPIYSSRESSKLINSYLKEHIKNYIDSPENTSIALTGGYDSRTLTALLGKEAVKYSFFSYGYGQSWDMSIPKKIAKKLGLNFRSYLLDQDFEKNFDQNVTLSLSLSQGTALFTQANIPYIYQNFFKTKTSIFTGLFGSELIKFPSGRGLFVDEPMFELLFSKEPAKVIEKFLEGLPEEYSEKLKNKDLRNNIINSILNHPVINNNYDPSQKFFYYLLIIGARKYFAKEIGMERPFIDNLHPFWDVNFIKLLIKTPYSWVHFSWSDKKRFYVNLKLHQLYARLIFRNNRKLSFFITTHATRPIFLISYCFLPFVLIDYYLYRKWIKSQTRSYPQSIIESYIKKVGFTDKIETIPNDFSSTKNMYKAISLNLWISKNKLVI